MRIPMGRRRIKKQKTSHKQKNNIIINKLINQIMTAKINNVEKEGQKAVVVNVSRDNIYSKLPVGAALGRIFVLDNHLLASEKMQKVDLNEALKVHDTKTIEIESIERVKLTSDVTRIKINNDPELMFDDADTFNWKVGDAINVGKTIVGDKYIALSACLEINKTNSKRLREFIDELEVAVMSIENTIEVQEKLMKELA